MSTKVLVLWHGGCLPETLQPALVGIRETYSGGEVMLEHVDRLIVGK